MKVDNTKKFFDSVAFNYSQRYKSCDHRSIFFKNRLNFAFGNEDFKNKTVLDIGAGSGIIYHQLKDVISKYTGCDISEEIMKEGGIPKNLYRVIKDNLDDLVKDEKYDYIFMLGVTTYLSTDQFDKYINQIKLCSKKGTKVIISFSLKNYIHILWRSLITKLTHTVLKPFLKKKKLLVNSGIKMSFYNPKDCFSISKNLEVYDSNYQNIFLPPFDRIFPYKILFLIDKFVNKLLGQKLMKFLSSDLSVKYLYKEDI